MAKTLSNPDLPAGAIVDRRGDGSAKRNDGVELQPANKNRWYVLATISDEQEEGKHDEDLATENRRYWNGWVCNGLATIKKKEIAREMGLVSADLRSLNDAELKVILARFEAVFGAGVEPPTSTEMIDLTNTYFEKPIGFEKYVFLRNVDFEHAHFKSYVKCNFAYFRSSAMFHKAHFEGEASFYDAHFEDEAFFYDAHFKNHTIFSAAHFKNSVAFDNAQFKSDAIFSKAHFYSDADFSSAKFLSTTRFDDVEFENSVPKFHATQLFDDTIFPTADGMEGHWPRVPKINSKTGKATPMGVMPAKDQKRAYNRLRLFMNRSMQIDEEMFFHRQEMACKAEIETGLVRWLFWLYAAVSDYGSSVGKPGFILFLNFYLGGLAF